MTIEAEYAPLADVGNGVTTTFVLPWPFRDPLDVDVVLLDTTTGLPVSPAPVVGGGGTYDYVIAGTPDPDTDFYPIGSVVFNTAPPATMNVWRGRSTLNEQDKVLPSNGRFPAKSVEAALDRRTLVSQEGDDRLAHSVIVSPYDTTAVLPLVLPLTPDRAGGGAGSVASYDGAGDPDLLESTPAQVDYAAQAAALGAINGTLGAIATTAMLLMLFPAIVAMGHGTAFATAGRTTVGDGGGGTFWYDHTDTSSADNAGSIRVDPVGRRWKAILIGDSCNVEMWGVVGGDGAFNPAHATANKPIIDNMLTHGPYSLLWTMPGIYSTTGHLLDGRYPHELRGAGRNSSGESNYAAIVGSGLPCTDAANMGGDMSATAKYVFQPGGYGNLGNGSVWFVDLNVDGSDPTAVGKCIALGLLGSTTVVNMWRINARNCAFTGYVALHETWGNNNVFDHCYFVGTLYGVMQTIPTNAGIGAICVQKQTFINPEISCTTQNAGTFLIYQNDPYTRGISDITWITPVLEYADKIAHLNAATQVFISPHMERFASAPATLTGETSAIYQSVWFNPFFNNTTNITTGGVGPASTVFQGQDVLIGGVQYLASPGNPNGVNAAAIGDQYTDTANGLTYMKQSGTRSAPTTDSWTPSAPRHGSWIPTDQSGAGLVFTGISCGYMVIGNMCFVYGVFIYPANASPAATIIGGLPFPAINSQSARVPGVCLDAAAAPHAIMMRANENAFGIYSVPSLSNVTNAQMAGLGPFFSLMYPIA